jgi:hypothetical protein
MNIVFSFLNVIELHLKISKLSKKLGNNWLSYVYKIIKILNKHLHTKEMFNLILIKIIHNMILMI